MYVKLADAYADTALGQEAQDLLSPCVQCGQCTFICPTFRLLDDEWDGPRGRIYLIQKLMEGKSPETDEGLLPAYTLTTLQGRSLEANLQLHLDRCLTCRSCEAACPQGVRYGRLLDIGRELVEKKVRRPLKERLWRRTLRAVLPYRHRFTPLLRLGQTLRPLLPDNLRTRIPTPRTAGPWPDRAHRRTMLVWQGCVQPALAPDINAAAARVLDRCGIRLIPASDGCCGALSQHMSAMGEARDHMRRNIDAMWPHIEAGIEAIVLTASGCGAHFRDYGHLLRDDPAYGDKARRVSELTRDIAEIVAGEWEKGTLAPPPLSEKPRRIAFQASCSLQHSQRLNGVVEGLLRQAGYKLVPVRYGFMCCGSAGSYSILQRKISEGLRGLKLETLLSTRPQAIATANIGCLTHLAAASPVPVNHWIELLDETLSAAVPH
ncbi:MAG TPA: glycolate oxidase subunit GlcF [Thiobacillaceae bacterium]|nr:glycolate oxidase subunit GlcF [Thiobacillaceae bacterium]HNU65473.1 glycolate oxidase subunit GlcF [Thiobacillaceae bacterium]